MRKASTLKHRQNQKETRSTSPLNSLPTSVSFDLKPKLHEIDSKSERDDHNLEENMQTRSESSHKLLIEKKKPLKKNAKNMKAAKKKKEAQKIEDPKMKRLREISDIQPAQKAPMIVKRGKKQVKRSLYKKFSAAWEVQQGLVTEQFHLRFNTISSYFK